MYDHIGLKVGDLDARRALSTTGGIGRRVGYVLCFARDAFRRRVFGPKGRARRLRL